MMTYHVVKSGEKYALVGKGHCRNNQDALYFIGKKDQCIDLYNKNFDRPDSKLIVE